MILQPLHPVQGASLHPDQTGGGLADSTSTASASPPAAQCSALRPRLAARRAPRSKPSPAGAVQASERLQLSNPNRTNRNSNPPIPSPPFAAPADQQTSSISSSTCLALGRLLLHDPKDAHPGPDEPLRCIVACPDTVRVPCGRRALKGSLTARVSLLPLAHCCWSMYRTPRPARTQSLWTSRTCLSAYKVMM